MSDFAGNLINRHRLVDSSVKPRLRSRFEPERILPTPFISDIISEELSGDQVSPVQTTQPAESYPNQSVAMQADTFHSDVSTVRTEPPSDLHRSDDSHIRAEPSISTPLSDRAPQKIVSTSKKADMLPLNTFSSDGTPIASPIADLLRQEPDSNPGRPRLSSSETFHSVRQLGHAETPTANLPKIEVALNQSDAEMPGVLHIDGQPVHINRQTAISGQSTNSSLVSWPTPPGQPIAQTVPSDDYAEKSSASELKTNRSRVNPARLMTEEEKTRQPSPFTQEHETQGGVKSITPARHAADTDWEGSRVQSAGQLNGPAYVPHFFRASTPNRAATEPTAQPQPIIKVTIGRIDVRAVSPPATAKPPAKAEPKPLLSLEDYLKQRSNRR